MIMMVLLMTMMIVTLECFVEVETEVGKDHSQIMITMMIMMLLLMVMLICTLEGFVKVETEVGKDHPELLPPVRVLELSEEKSQ